MARRVLLTAAGLLALVVVGYLGLLVALFSSMSTPYTGKASLPFDQESWLAADHGLEGSRFLMLDDLVGKHKLVGMSRDQVLGLLGPMQPPGYPSFGECYFLGPEDSVNAVDNAWLVLEFKDDAVAAWRVAVD